MKLDLAYIIQTDTPDGLVKIGRTSSPKNRITQIAQGVPFAVRLVCILADGASTERELKDTLKLARIKGEWYEPDDKLVAFLNEASRTGRIIEQLDVDLDHFEQVIRPKLESYVNGRPLKANEQGDLVFRLLHGEPLSFIGREPFLFKACPNTFSIAELHGYRPVKRFGAVVLHGRKIETLPPERPAAAPSPEAA